VPNSPVVGVALLTIKQPLFRITRELARSVSC
jgi:hypothetical protein